jgi:hypothetical protein
MYCSECGHPAKGKFCSHCGTPLDAADQAIEHIVPAEVVAVAELVIEWDREVNYETLMRDPQVRQQIDLCSLQAPKRMSGEQFLALADKLVPMGISMEGLAGLIQPLYANLGVKTGKERAELVDVPVGQVIVRTLCSLARHGQKLRQVKQAPDGCAIEAALPSDLLSMEGDLLVFVHRRERGAQVAAQTRIAGQFFDWGKSTRCLERLFTDLRRAA